MPEKPAPSRTTIDAGRTGFSIQSADGSFRLRLRGLLHSDGRFYLDDSAGRGVDTFLLRRVRPIVESTVYGRFDVRITPDFGGGTAVLQDAYVDARLHPAFKLRAGKFKPPFGIERLVSAAELTFIERALPTLLVPNRDVGLMVHGDGLSGRMTYAAGVFNGVVDGGSTDIDAQDGKDVVARLFAQPFRARRGRAWAGLGLGIAVSYGTRDGTSTAATGLPALRTPGQQLFFRYRDDGSSPVLADGSHGRISAQGRYAFGRLQLLGEQVRSTQRVRKGAARATLGNDAWQLAGSWLLIGRPPATGSEAAGQREAGAVQVTGRYSVLHVDRTAFPLYADPDAWASEARSWVIGANWLVNSVVKLQINYERTAFETGGASRRPDEHDLLTRVQFAF
jgi:phosphate-selective porin OprO/OprP